MTEVERVQVLNVKYRNVFQSPDGQMVLTDILNDCGFFSLEDMTDPSDIARLNMGKRILGKMGAWEPCYLAEITQAITEERKPQNLIKRLLRLPIPMRRTVQDDDKII